MSRIPQLNRDDLDADGQALYDEILGARGSIADPFRVWLHSPEFTRRTTQLDEFLRYHTNLQHVLSSASHDSGRPRLDLTRTPASPA